jgi:hypothetical protein
MTRGRRVVSNPLLGSVRSRVLGASCTLRSKQEALKELAAAQKIMNASLNGDIAKMNANPVPNPELAQQP